ncbi:Zn-dependent peptidase ImmA (M78 family) [Prauserella shujinwangii]|uniref:Zn-dependent peptidase ImmA (M78 family) n=1 Tax=Prauserella shujinwangii TaxID=1453103 RepID=A0A2T0LUW2_9PSEU|nr:XRE family transcriptional regulator [Prauserella shujinwangii]PRX47641.1 Zn-dependent peptidase ImmA (M78 family) [Prauserella shujinwangii]
MIYGQRVRQLRVMHQLTQSELAERVLSTQDRISRIENDEIVCGAELAEMLAVELGVTSEYLKRRPAQSLIALSPQFRARSRVPQRVRYSAMEWANFVNEEYQRLSVGTTAIPARLTGVENERPVEAAHRVRESLGFNQDEPLPYLVLAVERLGARVLCLPIAVPALDGFSAWCQGTPVIALMRGVPADRVRFTVAHELGHLVLHRTGQVGRDVEAEADEFASELLMPRHSISGSIPRSPTLNSLTMVKTQWGVSIKALVRRAKELGLIDSDRALSLYKQISKRGWNRREPGFVPEEKPRAFRKLAEINYGAGPNVELMAHDAGWSQELAFDVLDGYAQPDQLPRKARQGRSAAPTDADNVVYLSQRRRSHAVTPSERSTL